MHQDSISEKVREKVQSGFSHFPDLLLLLAGIGVDGEMLVRMVTDVQGHFVPMIVDPQVTDLDVHGGEHDHGIWKLSDAHLPPGEPSSNFRNQDVTELDHSRELFAAICVERCMRHVFGSCPTSAACR